MSKLQSQGKEAIENSIALYNPVKRLSVSLLHHRNRTTEVFGGNTREHRGQDINPAYLPCPKVVPSDVAWLFSA